MNSDFLLAIFAMILAFGIIMLVVFAAQWIIFWLLKKFFSVNIPIIYRVVISVTVTYLVYFVYFKR